TSTCMGGEMSASYRERGGLNSTRPGRDAMSRGEVDDIQRARIVSAMVAVAAERGYAGASVAPVVARAGISRRTFYEMFDGREECFLAAFEWGVGEARRVVVEACASLRTWRERVRHGLAALLLLFDSEPELARVCVVEALGAGKLVLARRVEIMDELTAALDAEAPRPRGGGPAPVLTAEGVVGGAASVIHARLLAQAEAKDSGVGSVALTQLHGQLMAMIALPYLGARAAGEELTSEAPEVHLRRAPHTDSERGRLLERLDMRLTYRTVRCLLFIGEHPCSSNREIAFGAEVADEGQTSKLLSRLSRLGLVANTRPRGPGYSNCWTLTSHGEQVLSAVQGR
ncbi:MAG: TetR/AcrR family transcriptional regulator, partial [Solirubrobacteraceae bacterium]